MGFSTASVVAKKIRAISSQDPQRRPLTSSNSLRYAWLHGASGEGSTRSCLVEFVPFDAHPWPRTFSADTCPTANPISFGSHPENREELPIETYRTPGGTSLWGRPGYKTLRAPVSPCQRPAPKPVSCWRQNLERPLPSRRCALHLFDCKPPSVATAYWARFPAHPAEWQALHPIPQGSSCSSSHDPKEGWPGSKGNMSFHFEPNFFHLRFAASMAQRKPKQLSFRQFPRKAETAFPCAWPMLDSHEKQKNLTLSHIYLKRAPNE